MSARAEEKARARAAREEAERAANAADARRRRLLGLAGVVAAAAVVLVAVILVSRSGSDDPAPAPPGEAAALFRGLPQDGPFLGRPNAPIVVEEYADLQCPFCADASREVLPTLVRDYVRTGRVRLRFRTLTFLGEDSVEAGRFAVAAGLQDRLWPFVERFYAEQGTENSGFVTPEFLQGVARRVPGLDPGRAARAAEGGEVTRRLAADEAAAAAAGVESTPTFLAGRRGGRLAPLELAELSPAALRAALDPLVR